MQNERLRAALLQSGMTPVTLAAELDVDPKTVERWITQNRTPYRRYRFAVAGRLGLDETFLWPDAVSPEQLAAAAESEIVTVYPHRWAMSREIWLNFFSSAEREIGILVYGAYFLADDRGLLRTIGDKAEAGARVRILLGDADSPEVAQRGADEGIADAMAAKIRNVMVNYAPLREHPTVEVRLHRTTLYNSIYRADDQLLVNTHIFGAGAPDAPVLHLRRVPTGDMVTMYLDSFEKVWNSATPAP
jgi:hypothetical protein